MLEQAIWKANIAALWTKLRDFARLSNYEEVYLEASPKNPLPIKRNYKNGRLIGGALLAYPLLPPRYLDPSHAPSFAIGKCKIIGSGDYKLVVADHDGQSDKVIKFAYGMYRGVGAEIKAEAVVSKMQQIYQIANEIYPGIALPADWIVEKVNDIYQILEIQQRAFVYDIHLFDPKTAERLDHEANRIAIEGTRRLKAELLKRGLAKPNRLLYRQDITDYLSLTEIHFDLITNRLVSLDIVDRLDIDPILPLNLRRPYQPYL